MGIDYNGTRGDNAAGLRIRRHNGGHELTETVRRAAGSPNGHNPGCSPVLHRHPPPMPPVTTALIVANVAIFLLQSTVPGLEAAFALWPLGASRTSGGQVGFAVWQLVTYGFLHGSLMHLAFNMFALYMFGGAHGTGGRDRAGTSRITWCA